MTLHGWLTIAAYAAICVWLGAPVLRFVRARDDALLHNWAAAYLVGQLLLTILVLTTGFVPWRLPTVVLVAAIAAAVGLLAAIAGAVRNGPSPALSRWRTDLRLLAAVVLLFPQLLLVVQFTPPLEWDARSIWMFHGKALYFCGEVTARFFGDQQFWWSNLDYPLHISTQAATCAQLHGRWDDQVCRAFLLVDFATYVRLLWPLLRARGLGPWLTRAVGLLWLVQGVPGVVFGQNYTSGQADYHYVTPIAMAALALTLPAPQRSWPLALLLLGRAATTKNEGMAYVFGMALLGAAIVGWRWWRSRPRAGLMALLAPHRRTIAFGLLVGLVPTLLWGGWKRLHGVSGGLHLAERVLTPTILWQSLADRTGTVLAGIALEMQHNGTWLLVGAWLVVATTGWWVARAAGERVPPRQHELLCGVVMLGSFGVVFATYVLTPHDVAFHMMTSACRVLFFPHMLLFVLCVFRLDALLQVQRRLAANSGH